MASIITVKDSGRINVAQSVWYSLVWNTVTSVETLTATLNSRIKLDREKVTEKQIKAALNNLVHEGHVKNYGKGFYYYGK